MNPPTLDTEWLDLAEQTQAPSFTHCTECELELDELGVELDELEWEEESRGGRGGRGGRVRRGASFRARPARRGRPGGPRRTGRLVRPGRVPRRKPGSGRPRHRRHPILVRPRPRRPTHYREPCSCPAQGSELIRWVQSALNDLRGLRLPVTGIMGAETRSALRAFQTEQGLPADGIAGPDTKEALMRARADAAGAPPARRSPGRDRAGLGPEAAGAQEMLGELEAEASLESFWDNLRDWWGSRTGTSPGRTRATPSYPPPAQPPGSRPTLRRGSTGSVVRDLQTRLKALGFSPGAVDGIFGSGTEAAVKAFQRARRISADGVVGPQTWQSLLGPSPRQPPPSGGPPAGEPKVTVPTGVLISDNAVRVLKTILREAGLTSATVTSGRRSSQDQARIMYELIERNGVSYAKNLYGSNGDQVIDVYVAGKGAGKSSTEIKLAMEGKIKQLGCHNVSHHCSDDYDVFDVGPSSIADPAAFRRALDAAVRNRAIEMYLSPPQDPAFHVEIPLSHGERELMSELDWGRPTRRQRLPSRAERFEMD